MSSEYVTADVDALSGENLTFSGYNVKVGYYLTGEHRRFKKAGAVWDRQKPKNPFLEEGGPGAWEIAARFSTMDLNDGSVLGGDQDNLTFAVNWYPNSAFRVMLNYVDADIEGSGDAEFVSLRFQVDF